MDWIRRNWPDLLIGVALFSVITGIVATLLSGGTILPTNSSTEANNDFRPSTEPSPSYLSSVNNELTNVSYRNPETSTANTDDSNVMVVRQNQRIVNPSQSTLSTNRTVATNNVASNSSNSTPIAEPVTTPTSLATSLSDSSPEVVNLPNDDSKIYKISVGAFGDSANARRLVSEIDNMGYKAGVEQSGNFSVVYVGPFPNRQQADNVASQLKASNYEASIYAETTSNSQSATSQPAQIQPTAQPTTNNATNQVAATSRSTVAPSTTSSGNSYLQVGAYRSGELSTPQSNQLEKLGFRVMEYKENGFVKLLLGPYNLSEVAAVKAQLIAQGIDSFPRSIMQ